MSQPPIPTPPHDPTPQPAPGPDLPPSPNPAPTPDPSPDPMPDPGPIPARLDTLPPAALRALAEAEARRRTTPAADLPPELGGRDGPEPVRYGDWEKKGIAVDF